MVFEIFQSRDKWYFWLKGATGTVLMRSMQGRDSKEECKRVITTIKSSIPLAAVVVVLPPTPMES